MLSQTEQFVDVALPISDVHAASRVCQQFRGLSQVLQPANAFFLFDRHTRRINPSLQSIRAVKLVSVPEFDRRQTQWQPFAGSYQTGVHQNAATGVEPCTPFVACRYLLQDSDRCGIFVPIRQLRRVVKNQKGKATASGKSLARAGKMTGENIGFADPFVAKEAVGRLGVGPVLTCPRRGRTYS